MTSDHKRIYLDNNATTPMDQRVLDAMLPFFVEKFGNAASRNHSFGWEAGDAVDHTRELVAGVIGASPKEIIFTSGATESDNIAIRGIGEMYQKYGKHMITSPIEHKAVVDTMHHMEKLGFDVSWAPLDKYGMINLGWLADTIRDDTILVSIMAANNEIGNINPIEEIGRIIKEKNPRTIFHTDATQAFGKIPLDVNAMKIDLMSISAHKIHGPKGVGALYTRRKNPRVRCAGVIYGGGHERGMRSGTLNVPGIVGLGEAARLMAEDMAADAARLTALRDKLHRVIIENLDDVNLNGHPDSRLPGTINLSFAYVEGESLMMKMPNVAVSSGSACTAASLEPSYVLRAIGVGDDLAHSSIRFSIGKFNTEEEIDIAAADVIRAVTELRDMSPLYEMAKQGIDLKSVKWKGGEAG